MIRPQLVALRNAIANARRYPRLAGLRMSACDLRRMPTHFSPYATRKANP